jgi:putative PIN family toxin of toxin-antitoxin system
VIVVVDSNVFLSALITPEGNAAMLYSAWRSRDFELATCRQQIEEMKAASRKPKLARILQPHEVGAMLNHLRRVTWVEKIPKTHEALDPTDAYLLDLAAAAQAYFLVTGDQRAGLLQRGKVGQTRILTVAEFCASILTHRGERR